MVTKRCAKCNEIKPSVDFGIDNSAPDGLKYYCKPCVKGYNKKYWKSYTRKIKDDVNLID